MGYSVDINKRGDGKRPYPKNGKGECWGGQGRRRKGTSCLLCQELRKQIPVLQRRWSSYFVMVDIYCISHFTTVLLAGFAFYP